MKTFKISPNDNAIAGIPVTGLPLSSKGFFIMEEIWKDIPNYEGYYQASNLGRIKSLERIAYYNHAVTRKRHTKLNKEFIKCFNITRGYYGCPLSKNGVNTSYRVNRLIAITFIPNPENKPCVNHIDGNKLNNHVDNLEWVTYSENMTHAYNLGLYPYTKKRKKTNQ